MLQTNDEIEISIPDLLHSIWDLRLVVLFLVFLGGIGGALLSWDSQPSYETRASMIVNARNSDSVYQNGTANPRSEDIRLAQDLSRTVQLLAASDRVLEQVLSGGEYGAEALELLRQGITVTGEEGTAFLWLTLNWQDPQQAVVLLNRFMEVLPEVMLEVMDIGSVSVIDTARQAKGISTASIRNMVLGTAFGFFLGCVLGAVYYLFVPKMRNRNALEALGLDVIGEIPLLPGKKDTAAGFLDEEKLPQEYRVAYGRLAAVFRYLTEKEKQQVIAVTSSVSGEGKSTVAYNLALQLTELGCKVLLLDFDFKKGVLYRLARSRKPKDGDVREEPRTGENLDRLVERMYNGIYTIQGFSEQNIFQADNRIFAAIRELKDSYDYILIDTPPVGVLADVQQMRGLMDSVLLVVKQNGVSRSAVGEAVDFLERSGICLSGSILNCQEKMFGAG